MSEAPILLLLHPTMFSPVFIYLRHVLHHIVVIVFFFVLIMIVAKADARLGLPSFASDASLIVGVLFIAAGFFIRLWASHTFHRNSIEVFRIDAQHRLVNDGPYRFSRNPFYVGIVAVAFGCALLHGSWSGMIAAGLTLIVWDLWIRLYEEKKLLFAFGSGYDAYRKAVPRWLLH